MVMMLKSRDHGVNSFIFPFSSLTSNSYRLYLFVIIMMNNLCKNLLLLVTKLAFCQCKNPSGFLLSKPG